MVLAYAGRLPGGPDFPVENLEYVREQIERLLKNLRPRLVVGSGAAGADLLTVEAALKSGAQAMVVLAGTAADFRQTSVASRGAGWERLFDSLSTDDRVEILEIGRHGDDGDAYRAVTATIRDLVASTARAGEPVVGLNVSTSREGPDHSADLAATQELRGELVLQIDPAQQRDAKPTAFVAMPFGRRQDAQRGWTDYDADASYERIILPALIDAGYRPMRADTEALLEVIDLTMLRAINTADVFVADLATLNPNVMWEVGVRHAWRRTGTILLRPSEVTPPFDVSHARVHSYRRDETEVSDTDAVAGIRLMQRLLDAVADRRVDSPVFLTLPELDEPHLGVGAGDDAPAVRHYIEDISLGADLGDLARLLRLADTVRDDRVLDDDARRTLLEQTGLALIAAGGHAEAVSILAPLADRDAAMDRVHLQQQYAHALIRSENPERRDERIETAERRLRAIAHRQPLTAETLALLGSAAKARVEDALAAKRGPGTHLDVAIDAYREGFRLDPGNCYPGVVALALLRLRGQRIAPNDGDIRAARELLPVVRFAATRLGDPTDRDVWRLATVAELELHDYLLNDAHADAIARATRFYARVAAVGRADHQASATRQLRLLLDAGDPPIVLKRLIALFTARPA